MCCTIGTTTSLPKVIWEQGRVAKRSPGRGRCATAPWRTFMNMHVMHGRWPLAAAAAVIASRTATLCCVRLSFSRTIVNLLLISHKSKPWSWNWIYRQKAHESSSPTIRLSNGNVKFSHVNRTHFTVGNAMSFPIVKTGNKPKNLPFPLHELGPHLT